MTCVRPQCGVASVSGCNPTCDCVPDLCNLPNPYVVDADASQECHCSTIIQQLYVTGLSLKAAVSVPACDGTAVVAIAGIHSVILGSYLWNPEYGHFKVVGFDYATEQVTLENECQEGNAAPGTTIPACTLFLAVDTPCCEEGTGGVLYYPYVAVDFTAPAVGACLDITVTTTAGLATGMEVQISTGTYTISSLVSDEIINICNDGSGVVAGTVVTAKDSSDVYQVPVIPIGVALCGDAVAASGALVVCAEGIPTVLQGSTVGHVPVLINTETNEVEFQSLASHLEMVPCDWDLSSRVLVTSASESDSDTFNFVAIYDSLTVQGTTVTIENDTCSSAAVLISINMFTSDTLLSAGVTLPAHIRIGSKVELGEHEAAIGESVIGGYTAPIDRSYDNAFYRSAAFAHDYREHYSTIRSIAPGNELSLAVKGTLSLYFESITSYSGTLNVELNCLAFAI